jgi:hypothetical protein
MKALHASRLSYSPLDCIDDRCGNVASILELDEHLAQEYKVFQHAPSVSSLLFDIPLTPSYMRG